jgi:hypothetical protein
LRTSADGGDLIGQFCCSAFGLLLH